MEPTLSSPFRIKSSLLKKASQTNQHVAEIAALPVKTMTEGNPEKCTPLLAHHAANELKFRLDQAATNRSIAVIVLGEIDNT